MSFEFVFFIIFVVLTAIAFSIYRFAKKSTKTAQIELDAVDNIYRSNTQAKKLKEAKAAASLSKVVTVLVGVIAFVFLVFATFYTVPVRNVGLVTSFNKPTGTTTGSGLHAVFPWQRIADFDASIQTSVHVGDWGHGCSTVRIGSLATSCVESRIQWQVVDKAAPKLYNDYKGDFNNLKDNLVETNIQNALNEVFATYNPLSQVNLETGAVNFDGSKLGSDVKARLIANIGSDIQILTVSVPLVHHDPQTEGNIKQFQDVVAQSRILDQQKANADKEKTLAQTQSSYLTPSFLQNKCIEASIKMGFAPGLCLMQNGIVNAPTNK